MAHVPLVPIGTPRDAFLAAASYQRRREALAERGAVLDDTGEKWIGSANLIALPDRAAVDAFMADEPFYKDGLYDHVLIERYKFGGRAGQVV